MWVLAFARAGAARGADSRGAMSGLPAAFVHSCYDAVPKLLVADERTQPIPFVCPLALALRPHCGRGMGNLFEIEGALGERIGRVPREVGIDGILVPLAQAGRYRNDLAGTACFQEPSS